MAENLRQDLIRSKEEEQKASCLHTKIWVQTEELRKELCTAVGIPSTLGKASTPVQTGLRSTTFQ